MGKLEDLRPHAAVRGNLRDGHVTVVNVQWFGSEALELIYKSANSLRPYFAELGERSFKYSIEQPHRFEDFAECSRVP